MARETRGASTLYRDGTEHSVSACRTSPRRLQNAVPRLAACDHHVSVGFGVEGGRLDAEPHALQLRHELLVTEWPDGQPLRAGTDRPIWLDLGDRNLQVVLLLPALLDVPAVG